MMDPAVKVAMACCVLLAGVCAATLVQRDSTSTANTLSICRKAAAKRAGKPAVAAVAKKPPATAPRQAVVVTPAKQPGLPPPLDGAELRVHKIIDGDSLPSLAERYLGDASRAREIYEANRDVLSDPQLLPIGVELKIRVQPRADASASAAAARPLTPIPGAGK